MIGAMPAVAVRHERWRQEKRNKRPSLLYIQSPHSRSATPSPLQSPPPCHQPPPPEIYICGRVSVLHIVVVSLLLGAVLLIVGLAQFKPGADASHNRYFLLGSGGFFLLLGVILAIIRCCILPWQRGQAVPVKSLEGAEEPRGSLPEVGLKSSSERGSLGQLPTKVGPPQPPTRTKRHSIATLQPTSLRTEKEGEPLMRYKRGSIAVPGTNKSEHHRDTTVNMLIREAAATQPPKSSMTQVTIPEKSNSTPHLNQVKEPTP